ncbi:MAG: hypothetical protein GTO24_27205, partial [candidate division Zixibacteria bacterium]|nr:hypothetical protein [candidate division Zixibacteria bacterium]
ENGLGYFKSNVIFTNGTLELGPWPDCTYVVSVPALRAQYTSITGADAKTFDKVKAHANRKDLRVLISFCITRPTVNRVPEVPEEWE